MTSPPLPIDDEQLFHDRLFGRMLTSAWRGCDGCRRIALETAPPERACLEPPRRKIRDVLRLKAGRLRPEWEAIWGRGRLNFHGPAPFDRYKTGDDSRKPKIALAQSPALLAHRRCQSSQNRTFPGQDGSKTTGLRGDCAGCGAHRRLLNTVHAPLDCHCVISALRPLSSRLALVTR
jgi:hypothetical protein